MLCVCDRAETFAYEAHGYRPASCILVSFIGAMQRWVQGSTMVSGARKIEMTALPVGKTLSIRNLKIAIQKLTDRRTDDLSVCVPQNFRASHWTTPTFEEGREMGPGDPQVPGFDSRYRSYFFFSPFVSDSLLPIPCSSKLCE